MRVKNLCIPFIIAILIMLINVIACQPNSNKEIEPNDIRENANIINPVKTDSIIGELKSLDDKDYFLIDLSHIDKDKAIMNISVTGVKGMNMRLSLFNENESLPFKQVNDFIHGDGESLTGIEVNRTSNYILLIDSTVGHFENLNLGEIEKDDPDYPFVDNKNYELKIELKYQSYYESEPNDSFETADIINIGTPVSGYFTPFLEQNVDENYIENLGNYNYYEIDLYKINTKILNPDESETEDIFVSINLSNVKNVNSFLVLFDENKEILEFVDNHSFHYGEKILNYTLKRNQDYYIGIMGIHIIKVNNVGLYKYNLVIDYLDDDLNIEKEDNDTYEKANTLNNGLVSGYISPADDEDWYLLKIPGEEFYNEDEYNPEYDNESVDESDNIADNNEMVFKSKLLAEFKLSGLEGVDIALDISKNGKSIIKTYDNGGVSEGETVSNFTVEDFDKLYIRVRSSERSNSIAKNEGNEENKYVLSYRFYYQKENMELEPNDSIRTATPVDINKPITGYINPIGDVDNYLITIDSSRTYSIRITTVEGVNLEWQMYERSGLRAPNIKNPNEWEYAVKDKGSFQETFPFKYIGESYAGEEKLVLRVMDYKSTNSRKYDGQGFNPSQMYTIRIIPRKVETSLNDK